MDFNFGEEIENYLNTSGKAWINLWDYWSNKNKQKIFDEQNFADTAYRLYVFLVNFGMARGKLRQMDSDEFLNIIKEFGKLIIEFEIFNIKLESVDDINRNDEKIDNFFKELYKIKINRKKDEKALFYSKLLLPLWGHIIAYDKNFKKAFRKIHYSNPDKYTWSSMLGLLLEKHSNGLKRLNKKTDAGNTIPPLRLIDMAYWNYGYKT